MDEDLIASLTRQVKEDLIQNYLTERRLIGLQIEEVEHQAAEARRQAHRTGRRLNRLIHLMIHPEMVAKLFTLLDVPQSSFWGHCSEEQFARGVRFIRVRALTDRRRFRKLVLESYLRLYRRMTRYREIHGELSSLCRAVNSNIKHFQENFDLLTILSFLKSLDTCTLERKKYLGDNFTAEELASVDQKLYIRQLKFDDLQVPVPLPLPKPEVVEARMTELAHEIYQKHQKSVRRLLQ